VRIEIPTEDAAMRTLQAVLMLMACVQWRSAMTATVSSPPGAGSSILTNTLLYQQDVDNIRAKSDFEIEFIGTGDQEWGTWTVSSKKHMDSQIEVSLILKADATHAVVLLKGKFQSTMVNPGDIYNYAMMERVGDNQKIRLVKNIRDYADVKTWQQIPAGTTIFTAKQLVEVSKQDLRLRWAKNFFNPKRDGTESFCLLYAVRVLHALKVLKNVKPVPATLWTADIMEQVIKFVDPSWVKPRTTPNKIEL
jgi:hypothetical protein